MTVVNFEEVSGVGIFLVVEVEFSQAFGYSVADFLYFDHMGSVDDFSLHDAVVVIALFFIVDDE